MPGTLTRLVALPAVDINTEPRNPIIGPRSLGSAPARVSALALSMARGFLQANVAPAYKHFPGHGAVAVDSHAELPVLGKAPAELGAVELLPYAQGVQTSGPRSAQPPSSPAAVAAASAHSAAAAAVAASAAAAAASPQAGGEGSAVSAAAVPGPAVPVVMTGHIAVPQRAWWRRRCGRAQGGGREEQAGGSA